MKKLLPGLLFFSFYGMQLCASSTRAELAVNLIPDSLLHGANTVVRFSKTHLDISGPSHAEYEIHEIVTVLNESGASELSQTLAYNQFYKITDFSVNIYDKDGKLLNKHKLIDMKDFSLYDGFSLFNDARFKYLQTNGGQYPVTIDRAISIRYDGLIDFPNWYIQKADQSVEATSLTVEVPRDIDIHFKAHMTDLSPTVGGSKTKTYTWTAAGLKAFSIAAESYGQGYFCPYVDLSPVKFQIAGYQGSMDSWSAFGATLAAMWRDKRKLPDDVKRQIKEMVKDAHSDREKIEILYHYLQKNFHYVSIQIGIGGWIPFDAATVHIVKYGDCKALSNYMCAILAVAGVRSHPVLINAGSNEHPIDTAFPTNHFNHAILCAEADGSPLWLECTSSSMPAGELGTFTESRYGLMIGDSAGVILATPASDPELNTLSLTNEVKVTKQGAVISEGLGLSGEYRLAAQKALSQGTEKEQSSYIFTTLYIKQPDMFKLSPVKDSTGVISGLITGTSASIADFKTGTKSFLPSSFMGTWYRNISADNDRNTDLLIDFPFCKKENVEYHIDSSASVTLPADFDLDNAVVYFHRKCLKEEGNTLTVSTELRMKRHIIHPGEIALLKESLQKVNKYLQQKVILEAK